MGFLDVSGLAFAASNLMQTLRTVPCTHMHQTKDGGGKRRKCEEMRLLAGYSSPEQCGTTRPVLLRALSVPVSFPLRNI